MVFVVAFVGYAEITKRHITDNPVEKAVGDIGFLKRLCRNRRSLIELLCYPCGDFVNLNAVNTAVLHTLRQHTNKITNAAGRLQDVAFLKSHLCHCLIDSGNHNRRSVKRCQGTFSCGVVFFGRE